MVIPENAHDLPEDDKSQKPDPSQIPTYDENPDWSDEPLTPREARLERAAMALRVGAIANAGLAMALILVAVLAATQGAQGIFTTIKDLLLFNAQTAVDAALISLVLLLFVNVASLLVIMVGVLAQEFWAILVSLAFVGGNIALLVIFGFTPMIISVIVLIYAAYVLIPDIRALRANPVMLKELRERMRGARAFAVITVYLALMSAFAVLLFLINAPFNLGLASSVTGDLGRTVFAGVVGLELLLIIFIAPAFTSGAVTGERERQTFDLLQITLLPRPSFIIGKLESALGYILLLLLAAIPLQSIAFLFGGVTEVELGLAFVVLMVTAITLGTIGLFFSTLADRTLSASIRSYTLAIAMLVGIPILGAFFLGVFGSAVNGSGTGLNSWSPFMEAFAIYLGAFLASLNPFTASIFSQQLLFSRQEVGFWTATLSSNGGTIPLVAPWLSFTIIYLVIAAVMIVLAVRRIRQSEF